MKHNSTNYLFFNMTNKSRFVGSVWIILVWWENNHYSQYFGEITKTKVFKKNYIQSCIYFFVFELLVAISFVEVFQLPQSYYFRQCLVQSVNYWAEQLKIDKAFDLIVLYPVIRFKTFNNRFAPKKKSY